MQTEITRDIIFGLLQYKRVDMNDTKQFIGMKHNMILCPRFEEKIETIFSAFEKYRRIVYDIQGIRDDGTDVVVRETIDEEDFYLCIQIKSEEDMQKPNLVKDLKAQFFDTERKYRNLLNYYIVLCCNSTNLRNKEKIRLIAADFSNVPRTYVIQPEFALNFLKMSPIVIDAYIKSKVDTEDIVYRVALSFITDFTPTERGLIFFIIWRLLFLSNKTFNIENLLESPFLRAIYTKVPAYPRRWFFEDEDDQADLIQCDTTYSRIVIDLDSLENEGLIDARDEHFAVNLGQLHAIAVLLMDGSIRYGYQNNDLLSYMMDLFGPLKGYNG